MSFWKQQPNALVTDSASGEQVYAFLRQPSGSAYKALKNIGNFGPTVSDSAGSLDAPFPLYAGFWQPQPDSSGNALSNNLIYDPDHRPCDPGGLIMPTRN